MPTLPSRAAAYTRTGILKRFLDDLSESPPARVDNRYAETHLGLKGGDVRAFLQSARVLGLIDPYGSLTERGRRTRAVSLRSATIREALQDAYPELVLRWNASANMGRGEVEDFFKVDYGLSATSAGPAAKLFVDLMREAEGPDRVDATSGRRGGAVTTAASMAPLHRAAPSHPPAAAVPASDVRLAALDAIKSSIRIDINSEWDQERIGLVFDRMERLVDRILERA